MSDAIHCDHCGAAMAISGYVGRHSNIPVTDKAWTLSSPVCTGRKYADLCSLDCVVAWCKHRMAVVKKSFTTEPNPTVKDSLIVGDMSLDSSIRRAENAKVERDCGFDVFWKAYPNKKAKPAALRAFKKALAIGASLDTLLTAITKQKKSPQWIKDNGQFIPHPATWLNQERWMDATDQTPTQSCVHGGLLPRHNGGNF